MKQLQSGKELDYIQQYLPSNPTIVEAGAFNGNDTKKMSLLWPQGIIHAFEPVPQMFKILKQNTTHLPNVHCYQYALSNNKGIAQLHVAENPHKPGIPSQASSLLKPKERLQWSPMIFNKTINVGTETLDTWAEKYAIKQVDFLWLDTQGTELAILQAAPRIVKTVRAIYTEVNFIKAYEKQPLYHEVTQWLEQQGFKLIAQDFNESPTWFFGNALFIR